MAAPTWVRYDADPCRFVEPCHRGLADVRGRQLVERLADDRHLGRRGAPGCGAQPSNPMAQRETRSWSSSWTAASAPAIAKSPWRRENSCTANPDLPFHTGNRTPVSTSSGSIAVSHKPVKKSAAAISRRPRGESASITASNVRATAGYSPAASRVPIEPPRVPWLRIWKRPTNGVAWVSDGTAWRTCASAPTLASVLPAPIHSSWPRRSMPCSSLRVVAR
jgi:hypothetical protein